MRIISDLLNHFTKIEMTADKHTYNYSFKSKYFSICFNPPTAAWVPDTSHKLLSSINVGPSGVMTISQPTEWILYSFECNSFAISTIIYPT